MPRVEFGAEVLAIDAAHAVQRGAGVQINAPPRLIGRSSLAQRCKRLAHDADALVHGKNVANLLLAHLDHQGTVYTEGCFTCKLRYYRVHDVLPDKQH